MKWLHTENGVAFIEKTQQRISISAFLLRKLCIFYHKAAISIQSEFITCELEKTIKGTVRELEGSTTASSRLEGFIGVQWHVKLPSLLLFSLFVWSTHFIFNAKNSKYNILHFFCIFVCIMNANQAISLCCW